MIERVTEREITNALKLRHKKRGDFFGSQIKMGPSGSKIMDGVAIPSTWSPRTIVGYEIKVTRSDFLSDQKYPHYMTTCNLFYFVVPKGLIKKEEVPPRVGILEYNNGKLRQLKRAIYENIEINSDMLLHCMFFKMNEYNRPMTKAEHLENVKAKVAGKVYGYEISEKIKGLERQLERKSWDMPTDNWKWFANKFTKDFGFTPSIHSIFDYISMDNRIHNKAIELLKQSAQIFKEEITNGKN